MRATARGRPGPWTSTTSPDCGTNTRTPASTRPTSTPTRSPSSAPGSPLGARWASARPTPWSSRRATPDGRPAARTVLLKGLGPDGFDFYTNYDSRKGRELAANPRATLLFSWHPVSRQVIVEGAVTRAPDAANDAYWASRPRGSRLGAAASPIPPGARPGDARRPLGGARPQLRDARHPRPRPLGRVPGRPERVEFWQGRRTGSTTASSTSAPPRRHATRLGPHPPRPLRPAPRRAPSAGLPAESPAAPPRVLRGSRDGPPRRTRHGRRRLPGPPGVRGRRRLGPADPLRRLGRPSPRRPRHRRQPVRGAGPRRGSAGDAFTTVVGRRQVGDDPVADLDESHAELRAGSPGRARSTARSTTSTAPCRRRGSSRCGSTTSPLHTWDLARAVEAPDALDPGLAATTLGVVTGWDGEPEPPGPSPEATQRRLLEVTGRHGTGRRPFGHDPHRAGGSRMNISLGIFDVFANAVPGSLYVLLTLYAACASGGSTSPTSPGSTPPWRRSAAPSSRTSSGRSSARPCGALRGCRRPAPSGPTAGRTSCGATPGSPGGRSQRLDPFTLLAGVRDRSPAVAVEIDRLRASGQMLGGASPALALGAVVAAVEAARGPGGRPGRSRRDPGGRFRPRPPGEPQVRRLRQTATYEAAAWLPEEPSPATHVPVPPDPPPACARPGARGRPATRSSTPTPLPPPAVCHAARAAPPVGATPDTTPRPATGRPHGVPPGASGRFPLAPAGRPRAEGGGHAGQVVEVVQDDEGRAPGHAEALARQGPAPYAERSTAPTSSTTARSGPTAPRSPP